MLCGMLVPRPGCRMLVPGLGAVWCPGCQRQRFRRSTNTKTLEPVIAAAAAGRWAACGSCCGGSRRRSVASIINSLEICYRAGKGGRRDWVCAHMRMFVCAPVCLCERPCVPVCSCVPVKVHACPCLSLCECVCPCLSMSVHMCLCANAPSCVCFGGIGKAHLPSAHGTHLVGTHIHAHAYGEAHTQRHVAGSAAR